MRVYKLQASKYKECTMKFVDFVKGMDMPENLIEAICSGYRAIYEGETFGDMTVGDLMARRKPAREDMYDKYVESQLAYTMYTLRLGGGCKDAHQVEGRKYPTVSGTIGDRNVTVEIENFGNPSPLDDSLESMERDTIFRVTTRKVDGESDYKDIAEEVRTFDDLDAICCAIRVDAPRFNPMPGQGWDEFGSQVTSYIRKYNMEKAV